MKFKMFLIIVATGLAVIGLILLPYKIVSHNLDPSFLIPLPGAANAIPLTGLYLTVPMISLLWFFAACLTILDVKKSKIYIFVLACLNLLVLIYVFFVVMPSSSTSSIATIGSGFYAHCVASVLLLITGIIHWRQTEHNKVRRNVDILDDF